jgi:IS5 family transposase
MRPKKHETTGLSDLFRARLEQIINMKHELVALAGKIDWDWLDREIAPLYSDKGRPGIETRFVLGLFLLKQLPIFCPVNLLSTFLRSRSNLHGI